MDKLELDEIHEVTSRLQDSKNPGEHYPMSLLGLGCTCT